MHVKHRKRETSQAFGVAIWYRNEISRMIQYMPANGEGVTSDEWW
jgi:hypothetical protein